MIKNNLICDSNDTMIYLKRFIKILMMSGNDLPSIYMTIKLRRIKSYTLLKVKE